MDVKIAIASLAKTAIVAIVNVFSLDVEIKNLIILFSFFSMVLMSVMIYILNERVVYLEEREPIITVEVILKEK